MEISEYFIAHLIEEITPYNNLYRVGIRAGLDGKSILEIMWDVGEILIKNGVKKIHPVAWAIYGKERGIRRSNITRDFLSYCFRIRKYFSSKETIGKMFPNLRRYSLFREAFPLLENPKYQLSKEQREGLIKLLNSNQCEQFIKQEIKKLKKVIINKHNDRRQRLTEALPYKKNFDEIFNEVRLLLEENNKRKEFVEKIGRNTLDQLSQLCLAFTQEGLMFPKIDEIHIMKLEGKWKEFVLNLVNLSKASIENRNRFRRVVSVSKIIELAEMIHELAQLNILTI